MKVSEQAVTSPPAIDDPSGKVPSSHGFSHILKKKKELSEQKDSGRKPDDPAKMTSIPDPALGLSRGGQTSLDLSRAADSAPPVSPSQDIEKLAAEMVDAIHLLESPDGTKSIDISFNSRTLDGLQVRIQSRDGELGIQFVTHSQHVAQLLSQHSEGLHQALQSRGLRVKNISVTKTSSSASACRMGYPGRREGSQ